MKSIVLSIVPVVMTMTAFSSYAQAAGCTQNPPGAKTVSIIDANASCSSISGQVGCRIVGGVGQCTAYSGNTALFTAFATLDAQGRTSFTVQATKYAADSVITGGGNAGSSCGYFYTGDVTSGSGMGFLKSNGSYQNVGYVDVCTNSQVDSAPAYSTELKACPTDVQTALDDGSIPGDFAWVGQISDANSFTLCLKKNAGISVTPCINEDGTGTVSGLPRCNAVPPNLDGTPAQLKMDLSPRMMKLGDNSCVYTCLPPPMTFGGRTQCANVCK